MSDIRITASRYPSYYEWLPTLPWEIPLEDWPSDLLVPLPRGISRHTVRFFKKEQQIFAIKEITAEAATHEYYMLQRLREADLPVVRAAAVVAGRHDINGEELPGTLITKHLQYSLPYRVVLSQQMSARRLAKVLDALVVLLVRLHLAGFYWGDMSLSNTLFRRDAGAYAAYLVDAETGNFYPELSAGQRAWDVEMGRTNVIGELMDLQMGGFIPEDMDVIAVGDYLSERYESLWEDVTGMERIPADELWRIGVRTEHLHDLGFDIGEISINSEGNGNYLSIQPKVVEAGHYQRQALHLTGLEVEEEQAKRIVNDINTYRMRKSMKDLPLESVAIQWMQNVYLPTIQAIPEEMKQKLEPAQIFHEVLEHRWYLSEKADSYIHTSEAVKDYVATQLANRPDEHAVLEL